MTADTTVRVVLSILSVFGILYVAYLASTGGHDLFSTKKSFIEKVKDFLFAMSHPKYWTMVNPYDEEWDLLLNGLMKKSDFKVVNGYTATIGERIIWLRNHPYGSFTPYDSHINDSFKAMPELIRPSRRTIHKAMKKLVNDCIYNTGTDSDLLKYLLTCRDMQRGGTRK